MPTIGVAVAIPEPWGIQLQEYRADLGDDTAYSIPTHITLIPPTVIEPDGFDEVVEHLSAVAPLHEPFRIHLRGTGTFRPVSPVVFVAVAEGIPGCEQLAEGVRQGPLAQELSFPFHPHVTVAHQLGEEALDKAFEELASFEAIFVADQFHLYVHDEGAGWEPTRTFRLGTPG